MSLRTVLHRLIAGLHAVSFGVLLVWFLFGAVVQRGHYDSAVAVLAAVVAGLTILPALALLRGASGWKRAWTAATGIVFFFWLLLPLPQHAIDRTPAFWGRVGVLRRSRPRVWLGDDRLG